MKKSNGFGLVAVIIIIVITSIVASLATGVIIIYNSSSNFSDVTNDEDLKEFIKVYDTILSKYYDEVDKKGMLNAAEEGMLNFLGDKYTTYLNDEEYQGILDELAATYSGIGIEIDNNVIVGITKNSPAEKKGLLAGDIIISIDGTNVENLNSSKIGELVKNSNKDTITLVIKRNGENLTFTVEKEKLVNTTIKYSLIDNTTIGYLYISKFSEKLDEQVNLALNEMEKQGMTSLILDVRDNVGGFLNSAYDTASLFLEKGKTIYSLQTSDNELTYKDKTADKKTYPIVILINNSSASAAEVLTAALKDSYGATLVGVKTYGKGKVQQVVKLDSGDSVKYTSAKWLTPNGICIDGVGISPDYNVEFQINGNIDTQLSKAIELLSE